MAMSEPQRRIAVYIGKRVLALRDAQKPRWSQEKLAREIVMSRQTVYDIEKGLRIPEWATLEAIAAAFGVGLEALLPDRKSLAAFSHRDTLDSFSRKDRVAA